MRAACAAGALACVLALLTPAGSAAAASRHRLAPGSHGEAGARAQAVAPPLPPGLGPPFTVGSGSLRLFDPTRPTPARGDVPAQSGRLLVTDLFVPLGAPGPLPLIVFAHGLNSNPGVYAPLLTHWAEAGFLVAAPVFPDSTNLYPGSPVSDYAEQARDISFVISSLLDSTAVPQVDPTRIAVAGHSDGGTDVALLALDPAYADPRVRAYVSLSSEMPSGVLPYTVAPTNAALFVGVGSADQYGLFARSTQVFDAAEASSKVMVVEEGGDHLGSFVGATPVAANMREDTTRFLERALEPRAPTSADLVAALENPGFPSLDVIGPG